MIDYSAFPNLTKDNHRRTSARPAMKTALRMQSRTRRMVGTHNRPDMAHWAHLIQIELSHLLRVRADRVRGVRFR